MFEVDDSQRSQSGCISRFLGYIYLLSRRAPGFIFLYRIHPQNYILSRLVVDMRWSTLPISFRLSSLALGQSYDCPSASEATLKDMGKGFI